MTKVKICGIKTAEEVSILNRYTPDYAGFVFSSSKRLVSIEKAAFLIRLLPKEVKKVGVFVNEPNEFVIRACRECSLDVVQLSGDEDENYIKKLGQCEFIKEIWKAVRVKENNELPDDIKTDAHSIVLDTFSNKAYGGTGKAFDWKAAQAFAQDHKIVLAGGLNHANVSNAIKILNPFCVDVSSGVEVNGFKDEVLVREFISEVKSGVRV